MIIILIWDTKIQHTRYYQQLFEHIQFDIIFHLESKYHKNSHTIKEI